MLDVQGRKVEWTGRSMCRRDFLRVGALGMTGLTLAQWLQMKAQGEVSEGKARSVIQLWMGGGPPHLDTFDPKPGAGEDYCGPYKKPIETNVSGVRICEKLPLLAKQADKFTIIRSMTHSNKAHETSTYIMQTGTMPSDLVYPSIGAVVAYKRIEAGYQGSLPPYISITNPLGRFSESGFLGTAYKTFATGGDPNSKSFRVQGIVPPGGVTDQRLQERKTLLEAVDTLARQIDDPQFQQVDSFQQRAYGLILGEARKAFDLSEEDEKLRERYGRNRYGQSCLLARRLVEHGVPFITVNWGGWDTHRDNFGRMEQLLPTLDAAFATLLEDLAQRGLLETTIVTWFGEFGRTPKIYWEPPWNGGRHHFGACFSAVVAGGGFRGGAVVGESDAKGEKVRDRPVYPWDLTGSIYKLLGIDPNGRLPHPHGCVAYVTPGSSGQVESGGLLTEIM